MNIVWAYSIHFSNKSFLKRLRINWSCWCLGRTPHAPCYPDTPPVSWTCKYLRIISIKHVAVGLSVTRAYVSTCPAPTTSLCLMQLINQFLLLADKRLVPGRVGQGIFYGGWMMQKYNDDANGWYQLTKLLPSSYISTFCVVIVYQWPWRYWQEGSWC